MEICWNSEFWFLNCSFLVSETLDLVSEATETWFLKRLRLGFWIVQIWWLNRDLLRKREVRLKLTPLSLDLKYLRYSLEDLATCHMSKIFQNQRLSKSLNRGLNRGPNVLKNVSRTQKCLTMSHHVSPECTSLVLLYPAWCSHALAQTPQQTRQSHSTPEVSFAPLGEELNKKHNKDQQSNNNDMMCTNFILSCVFSYTETKG